MAMPYERHRVALIESLSARLRAGARVVTTNLVLAETHALLLRRAGPRAALGFLREVTRGPNLVIDSTHDLELAARQWLERYHDQDFSLTDAVSFAVMAERGIREALTLDHHFAVAGFVTLPA